MFAELSFNNLIIAFAIAVILMSFINPRNER